MWGIATTLVYFSFKVHLRRVKSKSAFCVHDDIWMSHVLKHLE